MYTEGSKHLLPPSAPLRREVAAISPFPLRHMAGAVVISFLGLTAALAHAQIQRQVDPESGITTYSFRPSQNSGRQNQERRPAPQAAPVILTSPPVSSTAKRAETKIAPSLAMVSSSQRDFPRVPAEIQKERDAERRRILKQELAWEEEKLAQAVESNAPSDAVKRYQANIEALNREIRNVQ